MNNLIKRFRFEYLYLGKAPWDTGIAPPEVQAFVQSHPGGRALDLGCGPGASSIYLAQHGWQVTGVDFVRRAIAKARRNAARAGVQVDFRRGDVTRLEDIRAPFDLALDVGCFHSLSVAGQQAYLQRLDELLRPGGTYLLYALLKDETSPQAGAQRVGLGLTDLPRLAARLRLVQRQDGSDRGRSSAWFWFEKPGASA